MKECLLGGGNGGPQPPCKIRKSQRWLGSSPHGTLSQIVDYVYHYSRWTLINSSKTLSAPTHEGNNESLKQEAKTKGNWANGISVG